MKLRLLMAGCILLAGCQSGFVAVTIRNEGAGTIRDVEIDYPSGPPADHAESFGIDHLGPGGQFHYRFKPAGAGSLKLSFVDRTGKSHTDFGPSVRPGIHGQVDLSIDAAGKQAWRPSLTTN